LTPEDQSEALTERLRQNWNKQLKKAKPSLIIALFQSFGLSFCIAGIFKVASDCMAFLQPQLLKRLLSFVGSYGTDQPLPAGEGFAIAILMFACAAIQ
jgi:ATP-binding cassette, subfamily C (CFTR/MRP), member 1